MRLRQREGNSKTTQSCAEAACSPKHFSRFFVISTVPVICNQLTLPLPKSFCLFPQCFCSSGFGLDKSAVDKLASKKHKFKNLQSQIIGGYAVWFHFHFWSAANHLYKRLQEVCKKKNWVRWRHRRLP